MSGKRVTVTIEIPELLRDQVQRLRSDYDFNKAVLDLLMIGLIEEQEVCTHLTEEEHDFVTGQIGGGTMDDEVWEWAVEQSGKRIDAGKERTYTPMDAAYRFVAAHQQFRANESREQA